MLNPYFIIGAMIAVGGAYGYGHHVGWGDETPEDGVPLKTVYTKDITFAAIKALQEAMARIEKLDK